MTIPFSPPRIDQKIIDEVVATLKSGWITTGPRTKKFEKQIAGYAGVQKVLCLNSATAGLEIMLRWFGVKEGDEVILPAYTYSATANVVIHCGAKPILVDVNANDFNISLQRIADAITPHTKVIMPVDIGGLPCDYDSIMNLAKGSATLFKAENEIQKTLSRILVLCDTAHSIGGLYNGKKVGADADASVFSFHAVKNLTTAEGGAICLNLPAPFSNEEIYQALCIKSLHGQNKDALAKTQKGSWEYDVIEAGYKWNMPDILAAIGLVELERYDSETLPRRKEIFQRYLSHFEKKDWAQLPVFKTEMMESSYHLFMLRVKNIGEEHRNEIIKAISEYDVSVNVHFKPLPLLSFYKSLGYKMEDYPIAYDNYAREISLPVYFDLTNEQVDFVSQVVIESIEQVLARN
ncbi:MAG: DegT/DnrJ/EryC1/StrS aminotransferase family protein [Bacteroidota bacterium]